MSDFNYEEYKEKRKRKRTNAIRKWVKSATVREEYPNIYYDCETNSVFEYSIVFKDEWCEEQYRQKIADGEIKPKNRDESAEEMDRIYTWFDDVFILLEPEDWLSDLNLENKEGN